MISHLVALHSSSPDSLPFHILHGAQEVDLLSCLHPLALFCRNQLKVENEGQELLFLSDLPFWQRQRTFFLPGIPATFK